MLFSFSLIGGGKSGGGKGSNPPSLTVYCHDGTIGFSCTPGQVKVTGTGYPSRVSVQVLEGGVLVIDNNIESFGGSIDDAFELNSPGPYTIQVAQGKTVLQSAQYMIGN